MKQVISLCFGSKEVYAALLGIGNRSIYYSLYETVTYKSDVI